MMRVVAGSSHPSSRPSNLEHLAWLQWLFGHTDRLRPRTFARLYFIITSTPVTFIIALSSLIQ